MNVVYFEALRCFVQSLMYSPEVISYDRNVKSEKPPIFIFV